MSVWRLNTLSESWRYQGNFPDDALGARAHPGDGEKMNFMGLIDQGKNAFNEWVMPARKKLTLTTDYTEEDHNNIKLKANLTKKGDMVWIRRVAHWDEPFTITRDGDQDVGPTAKQFNKGSTELTVYLRRATTPDKKLTLGTDYTEENDNNIKLDASVLSKQNDVIWIQRKPATEPDDWQERFTITNDGDRDVGSTTKTFIKGDNQLTVYLERLKPEAGDEPHLDVVLDVYRKHFNDLVGTDAGYYLLTKNTDVDDEFMRWDHYRVNLPPGIPNNRQKLVSNTIANLAKGTKSKDVRTAVWTAITGHAGPGDAALNAGVTAIPIYPNNSTKYKNWVKGLCRGVGNALMDKLIAQIDPPTNMRVLRWPDIYYRQKLWNRGTGTMLPRVTLGIGGYCRGSGQAFFFSKRGQIDTFLHEMGHSHHLTHFAAGGETNFCWKHHDHQYSQCLMGYNSGDFDVPLPTVHTGPTINIDTDVPANRKWLCAKCQLKLRGWDELKLPCNWTHPDVF